LEPTEEFIVNFTGDLKTFMVTKDKKIELPVCSDSTYEYVFENGFDGKNIVCDTTVNVSKVLINALTKDEDGFYLIHNGKDLSIFSAVVNSGNNEVNARLTNDIDMSEETAKDSSWISIGEGYSYSGTFDGMGYSISHLYKASTTKCGLFGALNNAMIKNIELKNSFIFAAAPFAYNARGTSFINCGTDVEVSSESYLGTMGFVESSVECKFENCYVLGNLTAVSTACGLFGMRGSDNEIKNCYISCEMNVSYENGEMCAVSPSFYLAPSFNNNFSRCFYDSTLFFASVTPNVVTVDS